MSKKSNLKRRNTKRTNRSHTAHHSTPYAAPQVAPSDPLATTVQQAAVFIEAGDFEAASDLLQPIVDEHPKHAEAVHLLGLAMVRQGFVQRGLAHMSRGIVWAPNAAWMRVNRAAIRQGKEEHAEAIEDLVKALEINPNIAAGWSNLAASYAMTGELEKASDAAARAVQVAPRNPNAQHALGNTLARQDKLSEAAQAYSAALDIKPDMLSARVSRLQTLLKLGREADAKAEMDILAEQLGGRILGHLESNGRDEHITQAMTQGLNDAVSPDAVLAMALDNIGLHEQSLESAKLAVEKEPDDPYAWAALGVAHYRLKQMGEAVEPLQRALAMRENWPEIRGVFGSVLAAENRYSEAIIELERGTADAPKTPSLWASLGSARRDMRDLVGAEAAFKVADGLETDSGKYGLSLALTQIRQKNLKEGWPNYDRRWKSANFLDQTRPHKHPVWDGSDLTGKKILVYAEQGVGDEIMYAGFLQNLIDQGAAVSLEVNSRLTALFQRSLPAVQVGVSQNPPLSAFASPDFDCQIVAGALLSHFVPTFQDFRPKGAYMKADPAMTATLRQRYQTHGVSAQLPAPLHAPKPLLVGISWRSGNPSGGKRRSAGLEQWGQILKTPGVRFVNLQYGDCADEIADAQTQFGVDIINDETIDSSGMLDSFAAQVAAMDLVVSIDNSTVHFSGALGVPTFMMLNYEPDWRWFGGDEGNPWYESVAHVRQQDFGDWAPLMEAAADCVANMAQGGPPPAATDPIHPALALPVSTPASSPASSPVSAPMVNIGAAPRALLVNDTIAWYHWGCTATSLAIRSNIKAKGYTVTSAPIRSIYMARPAPTSVSAFDDPAFFAEFTAANPALMRQAVDADVLIVNGEGTLHGTSENVRGLLYFAYAAAKHLGKRVQFINHSCYPEDTATITNALAYGLYKKVYAKLEYRAFREHISMGLMQKVGIPGVLAFDSLPLTAKAMRDVLPKQKGKRLVIAGSASADDATAAAFAEYARWAASQGWTISVLTGARAFQAQDERYFTNALTRFGLPAGAELVHATSLEQWLGEIAGAGLVTTGRFHHSIAAFSTGTPFVAASSNTAKTNAIMQLLERPEPLPIRDPNLANRLIEAHQAALDNQESPEDQAVRIEAIEMLAMENYAGL